MTATTSRRRLEHRRANVTQKFVIGGTAVYLNVGEFPDGSPGEIFLTVAKAGSLLRDTLDAFAIAVSLGLQHGVPLATFVQTYLGSRCEPSGPVHGHGLIRSSTSIMDTVVRDLAIHYLGRLDLADARPVEDGEAVCAGPTEGQRGTGA